MVLGGYPVVPLPTHPSSRTPGTPPPAPQLVPVQLSAVFLRLKYAVGLYSVGQLSLSVRFSRFLGMTEVYNLAVAGIINNHKYIPGNE